MNKERNLRPPQPILVADLFPDVLNELVSLLSGLSEAEWQLPTVCSGWSVKDVALHMLGGEIGNLSRRRDGFSLNASINSFEELVVFLNAWNQGWVEAARRISPRLLVDLIQFVGVSLNAHFQSMDPFAIGDAIAWAGPHPAPVWLDIAREYTERWHHQQHIRDAVGKPGLKEPKYFSPVLDAFAWAMPRAYAATEAGEGAVVTLTVSGPSGGAWSLRREAGDWVFYQGRPDHADSEIILDEDAAWRLFTRGISEQTALRQMSIEGDCRLGLQILEMVSIIA
jgi:uncharacterized protein (TIGR03083 family)